MEVARYIMGFAGHMIDRPPRVSPRFPKAAEPMVRAAIREALQRYKPEVAVSSAACGGDIIFAEEALSLRIPTYIILPFADEEKFIELSVSYPGMDWVERFHNVCRGAAGVFYVNSGSYRSTADFEENQHAIIFFTLGYSMAVGIQVVNLILYDDTEPFDGPYGTTSFLDLCTGLKQLGFGLSLERIDMAKIRNSITNQEKI
jgi:hypothetical protein